jgi:nucleoside-diphosphate-sugar epimerase
MAAESIAVTGAGGFIGRATVAALQARDADIAGLVGPDDPDERQRLPAPDGPGRWEWGGLADGETADRLLAGKSSLIHLAGPPSVGQSFAMPADFVAAHAGGAATMLQAAVRSQSVRRVVVVSSAEIYGIPTADVVDEDHEARPLSPYAAAKLAAEHIAGIVAQAHGLEVAIVRPFAIYGPASPPWSLVGIAVGQALQPEGPILMNDLGRVRDLTYVDDVADLLVRAAITPIDGLEGRTMAFNAATGQGTSVLELARAALEAVGREAAIDERPPRPEPASDDILRGGRPGWSDPLRLVGSPARGGEVLGWSPHTDVAAGIRNVVAARRNLT